MRREVSNLGPLPPSGWQPKGVGAQVRRYRCRLILGLLVLSIIPLTGYAVRAEASSPGELVITFGRSILQEQFSKCGSTTGATESLTTIAQELQSLGYTANGSLVTNYIGTTEQCEYSTTLYPSWNDLLNLQTEYGWHFFSASDDHTNFTQLTSDEVYAHSCGTIAGFQAQGIIHPEAQFNYPDGKADAADQSIVGTCFDLARTYGSNDDFTAATASKANWLIKVFSIQGGTSNYTSEAVLANEMTAASGTVAQIQAYALVDGDYGTVNKGVWWRCGNGEQHQTSRSELYCASDFYGALSQIPAGTVTTNPYDVSQEWGRQVPGN